MDADYSLRLRHGGQVTHIHRKREEVEGGRKEGRLQPTQSHCVTSGKTLISQPQLPCLGNGEKAIYTCLERKWRSLTEGSTVNDLGFQTDPYLVLLLLWLKVSIHLLPLCSVMSTGPWPLV